MLHTAKPQSEGQSFHRRLLSEYNPEITLDNYVSYFELKPICNQIRSVRADMEKRLREIQKDYLEAHAKNAAAKGKNTAAGAGKNAKAATSDVSTPVTAGGDAAAEAKPGAAAAAAAAAKAAANLNDTSQRSLISESSLMLTPTRLPAAVAKAFTEMETMTANVKLTSGRGAGGGKAVVVPPAARAEGQAGEDFSEMSIILAEEPSSPLCAQYYGHHDFQTDALSAAEPSPSSTATGTPRPTAADAAAADLRHRNMHSHMEAAATVAAGGPGVSLYAIAQHDPVVGQLQEKREALTEDFFLGIKKSYEKVAAYLLQLEKNLVVSMEGLHRKNDTQIREKEDKDYIPSIYIQVECITRYRQLNLLAFRKLFRKFLERCACDSLRLQQRVYQLDEVVADGRITKSSIDLRGIAMQLIAVFGTVYKYSFEDTLEQLKIYTKKSHLCDERILPYSNTFFFGDTFSQQERQGHFAIRVLAGSMSTLSAKLITEVLQCTKYGGGTVCTQFANGEVNVNLREAVRGDDVYIVQSMVQCEGMSNATAIMELALMVHTAQLASAARIVAVVPYLAYTKNVASISALAEVMEAMGCDHVITVDMHSDQVEGMFSIPLESISAKYEFVRFVSNQLQEEGDDFENLCIVAPSGNFLGRAKDFADALMRYNNLDTTRQFVSVCTAVKRIAPRHNKKANLAGGSVGGRSMSPTSQQQQQQESGTPLTKETPTSFSAAPFPSPIVHKEDAANTAMQGIFPPPSSLTPVPENATPNSRSRRQQQQPHYQDAHNSARSSGSQPRRLLPTSSSTLGMEKALEWQEQGACPISVRVEEKLNPTAAKEEYKNIVLVGEVHNKTCIILDTVVDEAVNITLVAQQIKESGAARILLIATHAVFSGEAVARLVEAPIDLIITSDSVCQDLSMRDPALARKLRIVPIAPLLARAIEKIHTENTLSSLFEK
ncbi:ribose-phosphate pyrophosphokinase [Strigomonas culicis]|uniref:Ribose-phosphate pyrophosphokinase n=1 Tax=Strigomonas culicis TaxID=28005 RepID=S9UVV8_9TRYP|nr:ribose-phosphate pyrophosphokinase [Strigomonas culicis]|eukprot:EPY33033.1 ribose-phosphate pyrophosphokinase [Strigomonas culicis]